MKLAIIGATGFVGTAILAEALSAGHEVTVIVRDSAKVTQRKNLTIVEGDVFDTNKLAEQIKGHDAVLSAYNPGWTNPEIYDDFLRGSDSIVAAVKKADVARLLVVGGAGSLYVAPDVQLVDTEGFPAEYKQGALAARELLNRLQDNNDISWTLLSPPALLVPGERTANYRTGKDELLMDGDQPASVSVKDLAVALVKEASEAAQRQRRFTIGY